MSVRTALTHARAGNAAGLAAALRANGTDVLWVVCAFEAPDAALLCAAHRALGDAGVRERLVPLGVMAFGRAERLAPLVDYAVLAAGAPIERLRHMLAGVDAALGAHLGWLGRLEPRRRDALARRYSERWQPGWPLTPPTQARVLALLGGLGRTLAPRLRVVLVAAVLAYT